MKGNQSELNSSSDALRSSLVDPQIKTLSDLRGEKIVNETKKLDTTSNKSSETKRFDHHLIDQDLELEDKDGRRIDPKEELRKAESSYSALSRRPSE